MARKGVLRMCLDKSIKNNTVKGIIYFKNHLLSSIDFIRILRYVTKQTIINQYNDKYYKSKAIM